MWNDIVATAIGIALSISGAVSDHAAHFTATLRDALIPAQNWVARQSAGAATSLPGWSEANGNTTNSPKVNPPTSKSNQTTNFQNVKLALLDPAPTQDGAPATTLAGSEESKALAGSNNPLAVSNDTLPPQTIINQPVIERVVETVRTEPGVNAAYVDDRLSVLESGLLHKIAGVSSSASNSITQVFNTASDLARIEHLYDLMLTDATVDGVSGLTDADLPDALTASNYLPLTGGTLTGDLTMSGTLTAGVLSVAGISSSGALIGPYVQATSTSVASTFNGGLLSIASSTVGNGTQTGGLTVSGGATTTGALVVGGNIQFTDTSGTSVTGGATTSSVYIHGAAGGQYGGAYLGVIGNAGWSPGSIDATLGDFSVTNNDPAFTLYASGPWYSLIEAYARTNRVLLGNSAASRVAVGATTTPYAKLSIVGGVAASTTLAVKPAGSQTANVLDVYSNSGLGLVFTPAGDLGINQTSPTYKLDVTGLGRFTGLVDAANFVATSTTATSTFAGGFTVDSTDFVVDPDAGFVGIGGIPSYKFHISSGGTSRFDNTVVLSGLLELLGGNQIQTDAATNWRYLGNLGFNDPNNTRVLTLATENVGVGSSTPWAKLSVTNTGSGPSFVVEDSTSPDTTPFIIDASGNVGIGTASPGFPLHVVGTSAGGVITSQIQNLGGNGSDAQLFLGTRTTLSDTNVGAAFYADRTDIGAAGDTDILFKNSAGTTLNTNMVIKATGNVGIGTASPLSSTALTINGNIAVTLGNKYYFRENGANKDTNWSFGYENNPSGAQINTAAAVVQTIASGAPTTGYMIRSVGGTSLFEVQGSDGRTYISGNVGIGTSTPSKKLEIYSATNPTLRLDAGVGSIADLEIQFDSDGEDRAKITGDRGAPGGLEGILAFSVARINGILTESLKLDYTGNVGVASTSPWRTLSVTGTVGFDGLTSSTGAGSLCLDSNKQVVYNSASDNCLSSTRATKHAIEGLDLNSLSLIDALQPVSFVYNEGDGRTRYGFIAEDTAAVDAHLATYDASSTVSGIDDRSIIAVLVGALKELAATVRGFADTFTTKELHAVNLLCIGETCINESQLKALLSASSIQASAGAPDADQGAPAASTPEAPDADTATTTTSAASTSTQPLPSPPTATEDPPTSAATEPAIEEDETPAAEEHRPHSWKPPTTTSRLTRSPQPNSRPQNSPQQARNSRPTPRSARLLPSKIREQHCLQNPCRRHAKFVISHDQSSRAS